MKNKKKIYVLFVHGIGEQRVNAYNNFFLSIEREFRRQKEKNHIPDEWELSFHIAYWARVTQPDQNTLKNLVGMHSQLRSFFIGSLGDAIAYSKLPYPPDKYTAIQTVFADAIHSISRDAKSIGHDSAPLVIVSHSLGTVIASDGIYDLTKNHRFPQNLSFEVFITMGSPIALYSLRYGIENFTRPIRPKVWLNFYYPQDPIGYPLKPLNPAYNSAVTEDIRLSPSTNNPLTSFARVLLGTVPLISNLVSHSWYFTDKKVLKRIANSLTVVCKGEQGI